MSQLKEIQQNQPTMTDLLKRVGDIAAVNVGDVIKCKVIFVVKNQVLVEIPNIGIGIIRGKELYSEDYTSDLNVGQEVEGLVIALDNELGTVELSFRAIGHDKMWSEINLQHQEKTIIDAKIKSVNRGGFLVRLKGVDGFLPASLLSPAHSVKQVGTEEKSLLNQMKNYLGQTFKVKIVNINPDTENVIVSEKAVSDELTMAKLQKYKSGDTIDGIIAGIVDFGMFVRFDEDLDGLVHISEIAWKKVDDPRREYKVGDKVKAKIIDIDQDNRINLSIKDTIVNPWIDFAKKYKAGDKFVGKITKIVTYGLIAVSEMGDIQGLCHISQVTYPVLESSTQLNEDIKVGDSMEFTILNMDAEEKLYLTRLDADKAAKVQIELQKTKDSEVKIAINETAESTQVKPAKVTKKAVEKAEVVVSDEKSVKPKVSTKKKAETQSE